MGRARVIHKVIHSPPRYCDGPLPPLRVLAKPNLRLYIGFFRFFGACPVLTKGAKFMSEIIKITPESEVNGTSLACVLGVTQRHLRRLREDGVLVRNENGNYNLVQSVRAYIALTKSRKLSKEEEQLEKARRVAEATYRTRKAARANYETESAKLDNESKRMKLEILKGNLIPEEVVRAFNEEFFVSVKNQFLALPGRLAVEVTNCENAAEAAEIIKKEAHAALDELSEWEYKKDKFLKKMDEYDQLNEVENDEGEDEAED